MKNRKKPAPAAGGREAIGSVDRDVCVLLQ